jgi:hypothetical protein
MLVSGHRGRSCASIALVWAMLAGCAEGASVTSPSDKDAAKQSVGSTPWTLRIAAYGSWADNGDVAGFHEDPALRMGDEIKAVTAAPVNVFTIKLIDYVLTDSTSGQRLQRQRAEFTKIADGKTDANGRFELAVPTGDRYEIVVGPSHSRFNGGAYAVLPRAASDTTSARLLMGFVDHWPGQLPPVTP